MSVSIPDPEGNRGATPTLGSSFSYEDERNELSNEKPARGRPLHGRQVNRANFTLSAETCQRNITKNARKALNARHLSRSVTPE